MLSGYARNYVGSDRASPEDSGSLDFKWQCVTEMWFKSAADYEAFNSVLRDPAVRARFTASEAQFVQSGTLSNFVVEEMVSAVGK